MTHSKFRAEGPTYETNYNARTRDDYTPKYKWTRMWPGERCPHTRGPFQHFITYSEGVQAGRIDLIIGTSLFDGWRWFGAVPPGFRGAPLLPMEGEELTARQACRRAEEYWDAMCAFRDLNKTE